VGELGLSYEQLYNLNWRDFSYKCQGLMMKYQRLAVLTRQLAAVIVNSMPGIDEPVKPSEIFMTAFDEPEEKPKLKDYTPDEWQAEQERLNKHFDKVNNGKG